MSTSLPILIVGAGPSGLTTALCLAQSGVRVRIIDRDEQVHTGSRGFGIQPRTHELFQVLGILDDVKKYDTKILKLRAYKLPGGTEIAKEWHLYPPRQSWPDRPFANGRCLQQDKLEEIMRSHLGRYGVQVELAKGLVGFKQEDNKVVATVVTFANGQPTGERESIACQYLLGADGARGVTRKLLNVTYAGETKDADGQVWGDVEIDGLENDIWHVWGNPGQWSIVARPINPGQSNQFHIGITGQSFDPVHLNKHENAEKFFKESTGRTSLQFGTWSWISYHKPNMRMVDKFYDGRVFVIGDAAHIHSNSGGQGLNTSMMDAANLAWKLSVVVKGHAHAALLNTLQSERLPVVTQMLAATSQLYTHMVSRLKPKELPTQEQAGEDEDEKSGWFRWRNDALEQYGVNYRYSDIVLEGRSEAPLDMEDALARAFAGYEGTKTLRAGDRAPGATGLLLHDIEKSLFDLLNVRQHTVLIFTPPGQQDYAKRVVEAVCRLPEDIVQTFLVSRDAIEVPNATVFVDRDGYAHSSYLVDESDACTVIIRPDLFIGAIVKDAEGLKEYFSRIFGAESLN